MRKSGGRTSGESGERHERPPCPGQNERKGGRAAVHLLADDACARWAVAGAERGKRQARRGRWYCWRRYARSETPHGMSVPRAVQGAVPVLLHVRRLVHQQRCLHIRHDHRYARVRLLDRQGKRRATALRRRRRWPPFVRVALCVRPRLPLPAPARLISLPSAPPHAALAPAVATSVARRTSPAACWLACAGGTMSTTMGATSGYSNRSRT